MKKIKTGSVVKHKTAGYTAKVKKLYKNGNGVLTVTKASGDFGKHVPFDIDAKEIERYFKSLNEPVFCWLFSDK